MPISGKEMCSLLESYGWSLKRIKGSHHVYGKTEYPYIITVPVHGNRSLKKGLEQKIKRLAGI